VVFAIAACRYATATGAVNRINLLLVNSVKSLICVDPPRSYLVDSTILGIQRANSRDYLLEMFRIIKTLDLH